MWRRRRRIQQLEIDIAQGKAERAELRRRLDWFEAIAAAAGATPGTEPGQWSAAGTLVPGSGPPGTAPQAAAPWPPPQNLLAAARDLHRRDVPVRLEVAGAEVVAVVGGPGDPREWWTAIWQMARPDDADPQGVPA
jgi:hypothetical protein